MQNEIGHPPGTQWGDHWRGRLDRRLRTATAVDTWRGWGRGKARNQSGQTGTGAKYSSPLNMSIRINALTNLPFRFIQVLSPVEVRKPGKRR